MLHPGLKFVTFFQDRLGLIFGGEVVVGFNGCLNFGQCTIEFAGFGLEFIGDFPRSIAGRFLTGTTVGALIEAIGYVQFYLLTTLVALPGVILFWFMIRSGLADLSIGSAGNDTDAPPPR